MKLGTVRIQAKLTAIMVLTGMVVILMAMVAVVATQTGQIHRIVNDELHTLSSVISWNCRAAIAFEDREAAAKTLATLKVKPGIVAAYLYDAEGKIFSSYLDQEQSTALEQEHPFSLSAQKLETSGNADSVDQIMAGNLHVLRPVMIDGERVGTLQLVDDLSDLDRIIKGVYKITVLIILAALLVIFLLSTRLQRIFSDPIHQLIAAMQEVSQSRNYATRVNKTSSDEFGDLADVFNQMLSEIELRNQQLAGHRRHLEQQVAERTAQLTTAVEALNIRTTEAEIAREEAEMASRAKSEFLATMSHEIRTPMNGVLGMAELLVTSELTPRQARFAHTIQNSGNALLEVINDILDFSKIESGMLKIDNHDFHFCDLMESVTDLMFQQAHSKGLEITLDMPSDVRIGLKGDSHRLHQVLVNLIGNAIKFTDQGNILIRVIPLQEEIDHLGFRCEVVDSGIGIEPEACNKIFESFTQADGSTSRRFGGTGLGLAISKQLIELMGGRIGVNSTMGQGSTFWFELDLPRSTSQEVGARREFRELMGKNILIVDDNQLNREIMAEFASSWGMGVAAVATAEKALETLAAGTANAEPWDCVLLDYQLPGMDGAEAARRIRQNPKYRNLLVIMISSHQSDQTSQQALAAGVDRILHKPIRKMALRDTMISLLDPTRDQKDNSDGVQAARDQVRFSGRILVAEDNPVNQEVACGMLEYLGLEVTVAEDGQQAWEATRKENFELVLMDCHMPEMDGFASAAAIRQDEKSETGRHLPIIALTANVQKEVRFQCLAAGIDDYLSKPFTWEQLIGILAKHLPATCHRPGPSHTTGHQGVSGKPAESQDLIDFSCLDALRVMQRPEQPDIVALAIQKFGEGYHLKRQEIQAAIDEDAPGRLAAAAHFLKSSSASLGALKLSAACRQLEQWGNEGNMAAVKDQAAEFMELGEKTWSILFRIPEGKQNVHT